MQLQEVFELIVDIEGKYGDRCSSWKSFDLWPLIRQTIWVELNSTSSSSADNVIRKILGHKVPNKLTQYAKKVFYLFNNKHKCKLSKPGNEQRIFISRPVYLQKLPSGELFDRIVDPLFFLSKNKCPTKKYYVASRLDFPQLSFPATYLRSPFLTRRENVPEDHLEVLKSVAEATGLDAKSLLEKYVSAFNEFVSWYQTASIFLQNRPDLKQIYLTSWYFPDMMGICAAASDQGVSVIEVQHGKQGRNQAMYSGWAKIPEKGYALMPDHFWCWGQPSCNHILASSTDRKVHRPFVGGFPWLDFYKKFISKAEPNVSDKSSSNNLIRILVTTQPSQGLNKEPIPDFIVRFLELKETGSVHFTFRCHPNDRNGAAYCKKRLAAIPESLYSVDDGKENLYDKLLASDLHVTAYSSCCYEADALGVPTLLFGEDARTIYAEEIDSGMFAWTRDSLDEFSGWVDTALSQQSRAQQNDAPYIVSSLSHSSSVLASL